MWPAGRPTRTRALLTGLAALALAFPTQATDDPVPAAAEHPVTLVLGPGQATATPWRQGACHLGGGNVHVTQPAPDMISVTMTGAVVAGGHPFKDSAASFTFDLAQCFDVVYHSPQVKGARLVLWGRVVGLLRSQAHGCLPGGSAEISLPGRASVSGGPSELLALEVPPRAVAGGQSLSIQDREGPVWAAVGPGRYTLHQVFGITAAHGKGLLRTPASAEFAPDPALEENWISKREPFHGAAKKDLGFQVILKVVADEGGNEKNNKP